MKRNLFFGIFTVVAVLAVSLLLKSHAADDSGPPTTRGVYEYATIRWGGRDNTHVIRPNGKVEFVANQLKNFKRPDRADDRSFYMNIVMNGLAHDGWEVANMTSDDIVMRRVRR